MKNTLERTKFKFIFNDRAFEDSWAEPYVVEVTTKKPILKEDLSELIKKTTTELENDEGIACSKEGIEQILDSLKDIVLEYDISQYDDNFQFGAY